MWRQRGWCCSVYLQLQVVSRLLLTAPSLCPALYRGCPASFNTLRGLFGINQLLLKHRLTFRPFKTRWRRGRKEKKPRNWTSSTRPSFPNCSEMRITNTVRTVKRKVRQTCSILTLWPLMSCFKTCKICRRANRSMVMWWVIGLQLYLASPVTNRKRYFFIKTSFFQN